MENSQNIDYYILLIGGTIAFLLLAGSIVFFVLIYKRKILTKDLYLLEKEAIHQKELIEKNMEATESERRRVSRELHDEIGSALSMMKLMSHEQYFPKEELNFLIDKTIDNVRRISNDMLPNGLEEFGLEHALEVLIEHAAAVSSLNICLDLEDSIILRKDQNLTLYRIIQEMLNNTIKYGKAENVSIEIKSSKSQISLIYTDDGIGFDLDLAMKKNSLGLKNLIIRSNFLNGDIVIKTAPKEGFKATIEFSKANENNKISHSR